MKSETKDNIKRTANTLFQLLVFVIMAASAAYFFTLFGLHFIVSGIFSLIVATVFHNLVFEKKRL
ncbi:hypothetical protein KAU33_15775 [Candidatus Dependentiae bacterium]|nr:hypothetical protein [Candidatus Dependentiae bacterium]